MTQGILKRLPWSRGLGSVGVEEWDYRRVPKVSLLPAERGPLLSRLGIALLLITVALAPVLQCQYGGFTDAEGQATVAQAELARLERLISSEEGGVFDDNQALSDIEQELETLSDRREQFLRSLELLAASQIDWEPPLSAVLGSDSTEVTLVKVTAKPDGAIDVVGSATGVAAMGRFQDHMRTVDDVVILRKLSWEPGDAGLVSTANIDVRR